MASAPARSHRLRPRRVLGVVLVAAGALWTLLWLLVWWGVWELTGPRGTLLLALDWRLLAPSLVGVAVLAVGIGVMSVPRSDRGAAAPVADLATARAAAGSDDRPGRHASRVSGLWVAIGALLAVLGGAVGLAWLASTSDEGPYPFADAVKGELIAYTGPEGIRLVRGQGGRSWLVSGTETLSGAEWAPDGERLAGIDLEDCCKAYSFLVDGSGRARLPADSDTTPAWSPDGERLAVVGEGPIRIVRLSDNAVEAVLPIEGNDPAWSPDGRLIAFQGDGKDNLLQIYVVRADGSGLRALTRGGGSGDRIGATEAAWSPDGQRLAFASDLDGDDDIYVIRSDGTELGKITDNTIADSAPTWSPDGRRIAFDRTSYSGNWSAIIAVDLATGRETELARSDLDDGFVFGPVWQPQA